MKLLVENTVGNTDSDSFQHREHFLHGCNLVGTVALAEYDASAAIDYDHRPFARAYAFAEPLARLAQNAVALRDFPLRPQIAPNPTLKRANLAFPGRGVHDGIDRNGHDFRVACQHRWTLRLIADQLARVPFLPVEGIERPRHTLLSALRAHTQSLPH